MPYKYRQLDNHYTDKDKPTPQRGRKATAENKAKDKKAKETGVLGITRNSPKYPSESELSYLARGFKKEFGKTFGPIGNALSKVQNKAYKNKK
jgi:hypothetical protein